MIARDMAGDRGAVTFTISVLTCIVLILLIAITGAMVDVTGTAVRARAAADAAALAGAGASPLTGGDGDSCAAAQAAADAAEVTLLSCDHPPINASRSEALRVAVTVSAPTSGPLTVGLDGLEAGATAAVLPASPDEDTP